MLPEERCFSDWKALRGGGGRESKNGEGKTNYLGLWQSVGLESLANPERLVSESGTP